MWNVENQSRLIDIVSKYPDFWDHRASLYSKRNHRAILLQKITKEFIESFPSLDREITPLDVQKKWSSLRSYYLRLRASERMKPSGSGAVESKPWMHSTQMAFLSDCMQPDTSMSSLNIHSTDDFVSLGVRERQIEEPLSESIVVSADWFHEEQDKTGETQLMSTAVDIDNDSVHVSEPMSTPEAALLVSPNPKIVVPAPSPSSVEDTCTDARGSSGGCCKRKRSKKDDTSILTTVESFHEKFLNVVESSLASKRSAGNDHYITKACCELVRGKVNGLAEEKRMEFMTKLVKLCSEDCG